MEVDLLHSGALEKQQLARFLPDRDRRRLGARLVEDNGPGQGAIGAGEHLERPGAQHRREHLAGAQLPGQRLRQHSGHGGDVHRRGVLPPAARQPPGLCVQPVESGREPLSHEGAHLAALHLQAAPDHVDPGEEAVRDAIVPEGVGRHLAPGRHLGAADIRHAGAVLQSLKPMGWKLP